jgi:hypothetical protein
LAAVNSSEDKPKASPFQSSQRCFGALARGETPQ